MPSVRIEPVDSLKGGADFGIRFEKDETVMMIRRGSVNDDRLIREIDHNVKGAVDWAIDRDREDRTRGRHRRRRPWRKRRPEVQPPPVGPDDTMPLPMTPVDRTGRGYGPG